MLESNKEGQEEEEEELRRLHSTSKQIQFLLLP